MRKLFKDSGTDHPRTQKGERAGWREAGKRTGNGKACYSRCKGTSPYGERQCYSADGQYSVYQFKRKVNVKEN